MSCYSYTLQNVVGQLLKLVGLWPMATHVTTNTHRLLRPGIDDNSSLIVNPLIVGPVTESLLVIAIIELLRRFKFGGPVQVIVPTVLLACLHSTRYLFWGFWVAPVFLIGAVAYVRWRDVSFWTAAEMIILLHVIANFIPLIGVVAERLHYS